MRAKAAQARALQKGQRGLLVPVVIKTDAHAVFLALVGGDFVPEPAFEQDHFSRFGWIADKLSIVLALFWQAGRGSHEFAQARIFKFDAGATGWGLHVKGAADKGERMQMQAVGNLPGHDVYPAVRHGELALAQIEFQMGGENPDMPIDAPLQFAESRRESMKLGHRRVGSIAAGIALLGPGAALLIVVANLIALLEQLAIELFAAAFAQVVVINKRGEPRFDTHHGRLRTNPCAKQLYQQIIWRAVTGHRFLHSMSARL
jgi:hypothetical protein